MLVEDPEPADERLSVDDTVPVDEREERAAGSEWLSIDLLPPN